MKLIDKVALIEICDKRILVTKTKGRELYYLPGGKRAEKESDIETLQRELKEELTVDILSDTAAYCGTFYAEADGKAADTLVKMTCYRADYEGVLQASSEIEEMAWLAYEDIEKVSGVVRIIFYDLRHKGLL